MTGEDPLRALWRAQPTKEVATVTTEVLRQRSSKLARKVKHRNWSETIAGVAAIAYFAVRGFPSERTPLVRLACILLVIGEVVLLVNLWRAGRTRSAPSVDASTTAHLAFYRAELTRERDLLGGVARWYLAPLAPGLALFPIAVALDCAVPAGVSTRLTVVATLVALVSSALVLVVIFLVNRRVSRKLAREIEALDAG